MRSVIMEAPGKVVVNEVEKPTLLEPTDAIIKLAASCICGSDLWPYRGADAEPVDHRSMGHEYIGEVVEIGSEVTTVAPGDFVVGSFCISCGECATCRDGYPSRCLKAIAAGDGSLVCARTVPRRNTPVFLSQTALWLRLPHTLPQSRFLI